MTDRLAVHLVATVAQAVLPWMPGGEALTVNEEKFECG